MTSREWKVHLLNNLLRNFNGCIVRDAKQREIELKELESEGLVFITDYHRELGFRGSVKIYPVYNFVYSSEFMVT